MSAGNIIIKASESIPEDDEIREVCQLHEITDEMNSIDVTHIPNTEHRDAIKDLVDEYIPQKTRETKLKMSILLNDDEPVYQSKAIIADRKRAGKHTGG